MYSGLTVFTKHSGVFLGAHQKIDRVARKHLEKMLPGKHAFPKTRQILHFEGLNGPDGIKRKSPAKDEPWHYFNPFDETDVQLLDIIEDHFQQLVSGLQEGNTERASFEAAWLAHAMVDGLTPAHHYPYEEELTKLRKGEGIETRTTFRKKLIMPGDTASEKMKNNWKMWGAGGLYTTHATFEMGFATLIRPLTFSDAEVTQQDIRHFQELGLRDWYRATAREVAVMDMYHTFYKKGWNSKLAWQVRHRLGPIMVNAVNLAWYMAAVEAGLVSS